MHFLYYTLADPLWLFIEQVAKRCLHGTKYILFKYVEKHVEGKVTRFPEGFILEQETYL